MQYLLLKVKDWKEITSFLAVLAILIGLTAIVGWIAQIPVLYTFLSYGASMKFNTALSVLLLGLALLLLIKGQIRWAQILTLIVLLLSTLSLSEHLFDANFGIDQLILKDYHSNPLVEPQGRPSILSALAFILISGGMLAVSITKYSLAQAIILLEFLLVYSSWLGLLFNISGLFQFGHYSAIAFPTAIGLISLSLGLIFCCPDDGWLRHVFSRYTASITARYGILYFLIGTPLFVGLFLLLTHHTALQPQFVVVILIMGTAALTLPLGFYLLKKLNYADERLHRLTRLLRKRSQQLAVKNVELTQMNKDMDNIIHMVSHDLKTPVMSLQGALDILKQRFTPKADQKEMELLAVPGRSVKRLKETIDNLTQIIKGKRQSKQNLEKVDICTLIDDIKTELYAMIADTQATIITDVNECTLLYERMQLRSILYNLILNALKYHHPNRPPVIKISAMATATGLQLTVQDNGLGIPEKNIAQLFTRYARFHQHVEGTGVGLYLTKQLIEARGGNIKVISTEGEGTTFVLFFPLSKG